MTSPEPDQWFAKEKLYKDHIVEVLSKWDNIDDEIWAKASSRDTRSLPESKTPSAFFPGDCAGAKQASGKGVRSCSGAYRERRQ